MRKGARSVVGLLSVAALVVAASPVSAARASAPKAVPTDEKPFAFISPDIKAEMDAQKPLVEAATQIQKVINAGSGDGFTGIALGDNSVDLYWKGTPPPAVDNVARAQKRVQVNVKSAKYSRAELETAEAAVLADAKVQSKNDGPIHSVKVPVDGSGLIVGSDKSVDVARKSLRPTLPPVTIQEEKRARFMNRESDFAPFWGGAMERVFDGVSPNCTTGFAVQSTTIVRGTFILTAGHCGNMGSDIWNGQGVLRMGPVVQENVGHDLMLVQASSQGRIYDGAGLKSFEPRTQFSKGVSGWGFNFANQWICQSGMTSGAVCGIKTTTNQSYSFQGNGEWYTGLNEAIKYNGIAVRGGDSGGPVFTLNGNYAIAQGTNSGGNSYSYQIGINGKCIDTTGYYPRAPLQVWPCNGTDPQKFIQNGDGSIESVATYNGAKLCIDAEWSQITNNGTRVQLYPCNGGAAQIWNFPGEGSSPLRLAANNRCVDADLNYIGYTGTRLQLWDCNGQSQQSWNVPTSALYFQDFAQANADFRIVPLYDYSQ